MSLGRYNFGSQYMHNAGIEYTKNQQAARDAQLKRQQKPLCIPSPKYIPPPISALDHDVEIHNGTMGSVRYMFDGQWFTLPSQYITDFCAEISSGGYTFQVSIDNGFNRTITYDVSPNCSYIIERDMRGELGLYIL